MRALQPKQSEGFYFVQMHASDHTRVLSLLKQLFPNESEQILQARTEAFTKPISIDGFQANFLAMQGDTALGFCRLTFGGYHPELDAKTAEIHRQVLPEFRGQGLGHEMLKFLAEQAPKHGYQFLSSISNSPAAIHILNKAGFKRSNGFDDGSIEFTAPVKTVLEKLGAATDLHPA